jgi:hypothetical protein
MATRITPWGGWSGKESECWYEEQLSPHFTLVERVEV